VNNIIETLSEQFYYNAREEIEAIETMNLPTLQNVSIIIPATVAIQYRLYIIANLRSILFWNNFREGCNQQNQPDAHWVTFVAEEVVIEKIHTKCCQIGNSTFYTKLQISCIFHGDDFRLIATATWRQRFGRRMLPSGHEAVRGYWTLHWYFRRIGVMTHQTQTSRL